MPQEQYAGPRGRFRTPEPGTLGARLRTLRQAARLSQPALAEAIGTTTATISRYETNDMHPPDPVVTRLAEFFRVTKTFLRDGDDSSRRAPVVGLIGAGAEVLPVDEDLDLGGVDVPANWPDAFALLVQGDSMLPMYEQGGVLIIRGAPRFDPAEATRKVCEVRLDDGRSLVKEVRRGQSPGRYDLLSLNAAPIEGVKIISARPVRAYFPPA